MPAQVRQIGFMHQNSGCLLFERVIQLPSIVPNQIILLAAAALLVQSKSQAGSTRGLLVSQHSRGPSDLKRSSFPSLSPPNLKLERRVPQPDLFSDRSAPSNLVLTPHFQKGRPFLVLFLYETRFSTSLFELRQTTELVNARKVKPQISVIATHYLRTQ